MIFECYEQKYIEKVYLKFNLAQSTKQERFLSFKALAALIAFILAYVSV